MAEEPSLPYYLPIAGGRIIGFIPFPRVLLLCEMQSVSSRIWTRVAEFISYDDNYYTTGTSFFFRCLPPDRSWHKVNDYSGEGKVGHEPRLELCWSMLLIDSLSAMWVKWAKQFSEPKSGSGHGCRVIAWTRQQGLVLYIGDKDVNIAARPPEGDPAEPGRLSASNLPLISIPHLGLMPDGPAKAGEVQLVLSSPSCSTFF